MLELVPQESGVLVSNADSHLQTLRRERACAGWAGLQGWSTSRAATSACCVDLVSRELCGRSAVSSSASGNSILQKRLDERAHVRRCHQRELVKACSNAIPPRR